MNVLNDIVMPSRMNGAAAQARMGLLSLAAESLPWFRLRGHTRLFWVAQIVVAAVIAATTGTLVLELRHRAIQNAEHELRSLSLVLADQAERSIEAVDLAQITFLSRRDTATIKTPDEFRQRMAGAAVHDALDQQGNLLPQLDVICLLDQNGDFINVSHSWPTPHINVRDRSYFRALTAAPTTVSFASESFQNRINGTWAMVLARRVTNRDGVVLGISFAGVLIDYFEKLYQTVANGSPMTITLLRQDGVLLARYPHIDRRVGQFAGLGSIAAHLAEARTDSFAMRRRSQSDGMDRLVAAHTLTRYPMLVAVSTTMEAILTPWRREATYLIGAAILLQLVVSVVAILLERHVRGRDALAEARAAQAEAEAAQSAAEAEVALGQERDRIAGELHLQHSRFGAALGNMTQALCMFARSGELVVANRRLSEMLGLPEDRIAAGMTAGAMHRLLAERSALPPSDIEALVDTLVRQPADAMPPVRTLKLSDDRTLAVNAAPVKDDGWLVTLEDVTERRRVEDRVAHLAHHDPLTDLPNRILFHERLAAAVARSRSGERSAVLFLDLDRFKAVNDALGHPVGDMLLREATRRLQTTLRDNDTVARIGGDEFAIIQTDIVHPQEAALLAVWIIDALSAPYHLDGHSFAIGTSIGIALIPGDGTDPGQILKNADMALYRAKADGRGRYRFFEPEMDKRMRQRRHLELELRRALTEGQFELVYQPLVNLRRQKVCGFEALVRWRHPERGMVPPSDFIPVAEETGLIIPLGEWVLKQACRDAASWPTDVKVAVNLSPLQFAGRALVEDVAAALAASGLPANRLELEITETVMLEETEAVLRVLHRLRNLGIGIGMDDFGTGYSSLGYLRRFPFSKVKIDRSFIEGLGDGGYCDAIVAAVTNLCDILGMTTTAEGVETEAQMEHLAGVRCTEVQGYLFSRPRPASEVPAMCRLAARPEMACSQAAMAGP
jgi:diguanylate cyclase (GGDEF)-like protein